MALAYMRSFMGGLADIGEQMLIPADMTKKKTGTKLIRQFCMPQRLTKNQPHLWRDWETDPHDWSLFCEYNIADVVAEEAVRDRALPYPTLEDEWLFYALDQRINDRGMPLDRVFAENVARMSERRREELLAQMRERTGLDNPGSQVQLLRWLNTQGYEFDDIGEHTVTRALTLHSAGLQGLTDICVEVLRLRQWAARAATKKAQAALRSAGADDRIRYMFQFGGASRTQRFAGRLVQPQNMARTPKLFDPEHSTDRLDTVTDLIRAGSYEAFDLVVDEPMMVFGGTMRGMFRAREGYRLHVCDYSSIESVGLAWVSGCDRMLQIFRDKRDFYRDFGTALYQKAYEEITSAERQICKSACLGCFGQDTLVLTDNGWKSIIDVGRYDRVFDGVEFVCHAGVAEQGVKEVIDLHGVLVTPDHLVLCGDEWCQAEDVQSTRLGRKAIVSGIGALLRLSANNETSCTIDAGAPGVGSTKTSTGITLNSVRRKVASLARTLGFARNRVRSISSSTHHASSSTGSPIGITRSCRVAGAWGHLVRGMPVGASVASLPMYTGSSDTVLRFQAWMTKAWKSIGSIITGHTNPVTYGSLQGKYRPAIKQFIHGLRIAVKQSAGPSSGNGMRRDIVARLQFYGRSTKAYLQSKSSRISKIVAVPTYDIVNCGPRHRFVVWTDAGPMIVHNCGYGLGPGKVLDDGTMTGLLAYAANMGIRMSLYEAQSAVAAYRETYDEVPSFWRKCDNAAASVLDNGQPVAVGPLLFEWRKPFLLIRLPSGRSIYYYKPRMEWREVRTGRKSWDEKKMMMVEETYMKHVLTYMGRNQRNAKWDRIAGRGASLTENLVQALTRDVLKVGLMRLDEAGFDIIGHSHDEVIVESREGDNSRTWERMREIMIQPIDWLPNFPLGAAGWSGQYYRK
jgi:hypothetical protein